MNIATDIRMYNWMRKINKTTKRNMFPNLYGKKRGIGVNPQNLMVDSVRMIYPRPGMMFYKNEIIDDGMHIKYMMSADPKDLVAFARTWTTGTPIRVLMHDGPNDFDCGMWYVQSLDTDTLQEKHCILVRAENSHKIISPILEESESLPHKSFEIQTRSHLEYLWAKFFDSLYLSYSYEPKTFVLWPGKTYTPDFYLPDMNIYLEIKPMNPSIESMHKCLMLSMQSVKIVLLSGPPTPPFIHTNEFNEEENRYENDTNGLYSGMLFTEGIMNSSRFYFMEIDGKIVMCDSTAQNTIFEQCWNTATLRNAYNVTK